LSPKIGDNKSVKNDQQRAVKSRSSVLRRPHEALNRAHPTAGQRLGIKVQVVAGADGGDARFVVEDAEAFGQVAERPWRIFCGDGVQEQRETPSPALRTLHHCDTVDALTHHFGHIAARFAFWLWASRVMRGTNH
jgi:hypothetical protein